MEQTMRTIRPTIRERVAGCQTARAMTERIAEPVTYPEMDRPIYSGPAGEWDMMFDELERIAAQDAELESFGLTD